MPHALPCRMPQGFLAFLEACLEAPSRPGASSSEEAAAEDPLGPGRADGPVVEGGHAEQQQQEEEQALLLEGQQQQAEEL